MSKSFREVAAYYRNVVNLTHSQRVTRLYRKSLRTLESWAVDREIFLRESERIRARFNAYKHADAAGGEVTRVLREAEAELAEWVHPDMYTVPYMPGGSKFMRNPPPPLSACFPDGIPEEFNYAAQDVNCIQVPMSAYPEGRTTVLIDAYKKSAE